MTITSTIAGTDAASGGAAASIRLSEEQRLAVEHDAGPLIVLAGPGTGKTRVITARVAHLLRERAVDPETVLAVTFSNKAAGELRERLCELMDPVLAERVGASTMHAFGMNLLRRFGDMLGLPAELDLLDPAQLRRLARELIGAHGLYRASIGRGIDHAVEHGLDVAHELVSRGMTPDAALRRADELLADLSGDSSPEAKAARAELEIFRQGAELAGLLDLACLERATPRFDDLITWPMRLLAKSEPARDIVRQRCRHVVVDEFQDLNATQIGLLAALCPPKANPDICVVGDDDQSIYAFRGADERAFSRFADIWTGVTTTRLTTNYRSGEAVINASNAIIAQAGYRFDADKRGRPSPTPPEPSSVEVVRVGGDDRIAPVIASMIRGQLQADPALDLSTIAVIARTGGELAKSAVALETAGIPFVSCAPDGSKDDPAVRAVLAWAELVVDPLQHWAARSVLTPAPFSCDALALGVLEQQYRSQAKRAEVGEAEAPGPFIAWAVANTPPGDGCLTGALKRGAAAEAIIAQAAATEPADAVLMEIVRVTGIAHATECSARERAARVRALVALIRFARERLRRLDEPRDLRAFLTYLDDLPEKEKTFRPTPEQTLEPGESIDDDDSDDGPDGRVRLLTAHASKGLQFETVYIPRLSGGHGYPLSRGRGEAVPDGVFEPDPQGRDEKARRLDEERRVFFVALTRAERRAILVTKLPKTVTSVSYPYELRDDPAVDLIEHEEYEVAAPGEGDDLDALESESGTAKNRRAIIASARRAARREAAAALDDAERCNEIGPALVDRLRASADRLAMISHVARTGAPPDWAEAKGLAPDAARLRDQLRRDTGPGVDYGGLAGPLKLSYSAINQYLRCPRCYLLYCVLRVPQRETANLGIGVAAHRALEQFIIRFRAADSEGTPTPGWAELERLTLESLRECWPRTVEFDPAERERLLAQARIFYDSMHDPRAQVSEFVEQSFKIPYELHGVTHHISGKIDRIDTGPRGEHRLIDYKTGNPNEDLRTPKNNDLQMGIYAMALDHLVGERAPGSTGEYWILSSGEKGVIALDDLKMDKVRAKIDKAVTGMAEGHWDQGSRCSGECDFLEDAAMTARASARHASADDEETPWSGDDDEPA